jgi:hypothetical protein
MSVSFFSKKNFIVLLMVQHLEEDVFATSMRTPVAKNT